MKPKFIVVSITIICSIITSSCTGLTSLVGLDSPSRTSDVVFSVSLPAPLEEGEKIFIEILDEVTGINLNPKRFELQAANGGRYSIKMAFPTGSQVLYRYFRGGEHGSLEKDMYGKTIDRRVVLVSGTETVNDVISTWDEPVVPTFTSQISGFIYDENTKAPLAEILVYVNGIKAVTSHSGFYQIENLPAGEFNLTAVHPDGTFRTFQHKAVLADNSITPASFGMTPSRFVTITFDVELPDDTPEKAVVRLLGNMLSMGNTFSLFPDGSSLLASRAPQLQLQDDNRYSISLKLPVGFDFRYKYSLGDGLINAEHNDKGYFFTRQLIVPNRNLTIHDEIVTWFSTAGQPIKLNIRVPASTKADVVSIQLNPFVWMNPIPMWKVSESQWEYTLFSPLEYLQNTQFRFCQNDQCGVADDGMTAGKESTGYSFLHEGRLLTNITYEIDKWAWSESIDYAVMQADFSQPHGIVIKGFSLSDKFDKSWPPYLLGGLIDAGVSGANWLIMSPGWTFHNQPSYQAKMNWMENPSYHEILYVKKLSNEIGMDLAIFPQPRFESHASAYWKEADITFPGWEQWFRNYERMILNYADFAQNNSVSTLIIGGGKVASAFPNGVLPDGSPANTPYYFAEKWTALIDQVRAKFNGQIGFALPLNQVQNDALFPIIELCDFIYLQVNPLPGEWGQAGVAELENMIGQTIDQDVYPVYEKARKPIIMGLNYYAMPGSHADCPESDLSCSALYWQSVYSGKITPNVFEQADLYQASLRALILRPWISGVVSEGFNPVVSNQDASNSVRGKPAMQVLTYFFNGLIR